MSDWRQAMAEELGKVRGEVERVDESMKTRLGTLRRDVARELAVQEEINGEIVGVLAEMGATIQIVSEQVQKQSKQVARLSEKVTSLGRSQARHVAAFDQAVAGLEGDLDAVQRDAARHQAELQRKADDSDGRLESIERETRNLCARVEAIERRLAG